MSRRNDSQRPDGPGRFSLGGLLRGRGSNGARQGGGRAHGSGRDGAPTRNNPPRNVAGHATAFAQRRIASLRANLGDRGAVLFIALGLLGLVVVGGLMWYQVIKSPQLSKQGENVRTSIEDVMPKRGTIYDRNGNVLATSVDARDVYVNPEEADNPEREAAELQQVLGGKREDWLAKLRGDGTFVYLVRQLEMDKVEKLKAKKLPGVHFLPTSKRVYPYKQVGGQVVGFVNTDGEGVSGLELYYDAILRGRPGREVAEYGRSSIPIPGAVRERVAPIDGQDIVVSLDIGMQEHVERALDESVKRTEGKSGSALLYDGATGEIYAAASVPFFNPADLKKVEPGATELKCITQAFEPGSIFKPVTMLAAFEDNLYGPDDTIFCPAALPADEYKVTDAHDRGDETMTLRRIMADSSNVGMSLIGKKVGFPKVYEKIQTYGLHKATGVDSPGEAVGYLADQKRWSVIQSYNITFGQGVTVTPLQMARFYGAIDNDGVACTPHFLMRKADEKDDIRYETEKVINNTAAIPPMIDCMEAVVDQGTGDEAAIEGFKVAGKTGTAEFADGQGRYEKGVYNISFIGFLPKTNSKLVCFVGSNEVPGDRITAPAFRDIMTYAIERYRIAPDHN